MTSPSLNLGLPVAGLGGITSTGSDQASAYPLQIQETVFTSSPPGTGSRLPGPNNNELTIFNEDAVNAHTLWPGAGDSIGTNAANAFVTIAASSAAKIATFDNPQTPQPRTWHMMSSSAGSSGPSGPAGGDLGGTYPNPTVLSVADITTGTLSVAHGGTGLGAVGNSGGVLAYTATGTLSSSAVLAANRIVVGGGAGLTPATLGTGGTATQVLHGGAGAPTWSQVSLTADVTGLLPFANIATLTAGALAGNSGTVGAAIGAIAVGANLTLTAGTLTANASGGTPLTISDGSASVTNTGSILVTGGSISGAAGNATLTITGATGVTSVIAQGGPFLANGTITSAGTINNSTASLTPHGVLLGEGTSAAVATAAMTNGQLLIGATGADPAPQTMTGDATINAGGTITVSKVAGNTLSANLGAVMNSGTVSVNNVTTLTGTAAGTLTLAATTGTSDIVITMPASGGTVTLAAAPTFKRQRYEVDIVQGATAGSIVLNAGFVFGASGGPTGYTASATAAAVDRLMMISPDGTKLAVLAVAQGFTI